MENFEIFVLDMIKARGINIDDPIVRDEFMRTVSNRLMNQINRNIMSALPDHIIDEISLLADQGKMEEIREIINKSGIDQQAIITRTMIEFRKRYLEG